MLFFFELLSFFFNESPLATKFSSAAAYCFAFRGVWALGVIVVTNQNELSFSRKWPFVFPKIDPSVSAVDEGVVMKPHLNAALRAEILYFTTQGIIFSANEFHRGSNGGLVDDEDGKHNGPEDSVQTSESRQNSSDIRESSFSFKDKLDFG